MKVFVTGASGFVGREVVRQLLKSDHQVRVLLRSESSGVRAENLEISVGDTTQPESLFPAVAGCDAVIHLVGIIREFQSRGITYDTLHRESTLNVLAAAEQCGVSRYLQMSANGTSAAATSGYHQSKWAAEQLVRQSSLNWTIFRPSLIFGPDDLFVNMLAGLIRKLPIVPVLGDGKYRLQPVSVSNVAEGFVTSLSDPKCHAKTYHCGGPHAYSYNKVLDLIGVALGKKSVCKLHHPLFLMKPVISVLQSFPQFPMTSDQLQMLLDENICDPTTWSADLNIMLDDFAQGISKYIH